MSSFFRRAARRMKKALGMAPPPGRKTPLVRNTYPTLGGDYSISNLRGVIRLSRLDERAAARVQHTTLLVPGFGYDGMEDNDIRGHLDGTFQYAWNQVSQKYVRAGRIEDLFKYGEYELFRALQRWADLPFADTVSVEDVELRLAVRPDERKFSRSVLLYALRRDWNPGAGGTARDNLTPPAPGEVWWNDARFGEEPWGLPGASSSDDLDPAPLAEGTLGSESDEFVFASPRLTRYVGEQVARKAPLLFMLKLQDRQEDIPGSMIAIWSATEGDNRTPGRKPRLTVRWSMPGETLLEEEVLVEPGRSQEFPTKGADLVSFDPHSDEPLELTARAPGGAWRVLEDGRLRSGESELRVRAVSNATPLGTPFDASFRDTWVRTAPPEDQDVLCLFESPTGRRLEILARYDGDFRWVFELTPDEVGRWRYRWSHGLQVEGFQAQEGTFDVVLDGLEEAIQALRWFQGEVIAAAFDDREDHARLMVRFAKLERAAMATLTPQEFRGDVGARLIEAIRGVRAAFGPFPESLPMEPADPHPWQDGEPA